MIMSRYSWYEGDFYYRQREYFDISFLEQILQQIFLIKHLADCYELLNKSFSRSFTKSRRETIARSRSFTNSKDFSLFPCSILLHKKK